MSKPPRAATGSGPSVPVPKPPRPRSSEEVAQSSVTSGSENGSERASVSLRQLLHAAAEAVSEVAALEERVRELEALLSRQQSEAERREKFLIDEQDRFLADLIEEHEAAVEKATQERDEALAELRRRQPKDSPSKGAPSDLAKERDALSADLTETKRTVERLLMERDRTLDMLEHLKAQRNSALRELTQLKKNSSPVTAQSRPTDAPVKKDASLDEDWDLGTLLAPAPSTSPPPNAASPAVPAPMVSKHPRPAVRKAAPAPAELQKVVPSTAPARGGQQNHIGIGVDCELSDGTRTAAIVNEISLAGAFIRTEHQLSFGSELTVRIRLPGFDGSVELGAVVRWIGPDGAGLQWGLLGPLETRGLMRLISQRPTRHSDRPDRVATNR